MPSGRSTRNPKSPIDAASRTEASSGNVFADLGIPDPDLAIAKADLVQRIRELIKERNLTQTGAAALLGLDQPKVSALLRGRAAGYSIDRLFRFLNALGQRVEINIKPAYKLTNAKRRRGILVSG